MLEKIPRSAENFDRGEWLKKYIRTVPDWPKKGVMFRDITTLLKSREGFSKTIDILEERYCGMDIGVVVGIESRGFIIGSALADRLKLGIVPIRKKNKLPAKTVSEEYELEYGKDCIEMHEDAIKEGERVLLIDDLIATGGTAIASCKLIEKLKGEIVECGFVINLPDLGGRKKLEKEGYKTYALLEFEGG
ncbi:MAG: adenine phosphoribosyltransferase [Candidatus Micrarchaeota archaeon]